MNDLSGFSAAILSRTDAEWSYDKKLGRYRDAKGRFLSKTMVRALIDRRVERLDENLRSITTALAERRIPLNEWERQFRDYLKEAHIQVAVIGHGGRKSMTQADFGRIGQILRVEYQYLQRFALSIMDLRVTPAMALARASLYAESVRQSYWTGVQLRQQDLGYSLMRRKLAPNVQHCDDCIRYAAQGMVSIGQVPLPGQRCRCVSRCRCTVEYFRQQLNVPL